MSLTIPLLCSLALLGGSAPGAEARDLRDVSGPREPAFAAGRLIVRFEQPTTFGEATELLGGRRYVVARELVDRLDLFLVLIADGSSSEVARTGLEALSEVRYAVPDALLESRQTTPGDPEFGQQWALHNTGQTGGTPGADVSAPAAWDLATGDSELVIAIVDGGAAHDHVDLIDNRWENAAEVGGLPGVDDDANGYVDDLYGWNAFLDTGAIFPDYHGTRVAGVAGARGDNGLGIAGVSWSTRLMHISGSSTLTSIALAAYGYVYAQRELWDSSGGAAGARVVVVNSSFGVNGADCAAPTYQPWNDVYDLMGGAGILNVGATTNSDVDVDLVGDVPTSCGSPWLITVTSTGPDDGRSNAGYGATSIDLGAPGEFVISTVPGDTYNATSGTSMASPHVAGAIALMHAAAAPAFRSWYAADPAQAALELKALLLASVDVVPDLSAVTTSGGRLNLFGAVQAIRSWGGLGTAFCAGDPTCPCGAAPVPGDGEGCLNATGHGAYLTAAGVPSVSADSLVLSVHQAVPSEVGIYVQSTTRTAPTAFHNGLLCLPLDAHLIRHHAPPLVLPTLTDAAGGGSNAQAMSLGDFLGDGAPGVELHYQFWSRDAANPCGAGGNFSAGLTILWSL